MRPSNHEHRPDSPSVSLKHDAEWDAGELGCGDLVFELRKQVRRIPGRVLKVIALDSGAAADLAAWCRMTGNELIAHDPVSQTFWIRARV